MWLGISTTSNLLQHSTPQNLQHNVSDEADVLLFPWEVVENGGQGWGITRDGRKKGTNAYITSHKWCKRRQLIDLIASGLTAEYMDTR